MSIIIKRGGNFKPAPEGICKAVCVDVVEMDNVSTAYGIKDLVRIVWETDNLMDDGRPFLASKRYSKTINIKSNLRKALRAWRGKDYTDEELDNFDIEKVIGASCQLNIVHEVGKDGNTYANIDAIIKSKEKLEPTGRYIRIKDRPEQEKKVVTIGAKKEEEDDDVSY